MVINSRFLEFSLSDQKQVAHNVVSLHTVWIAEIRVKDSMAELYLDILINV